MSRCPYCLHILKDAWVKKEGAALMGKTSGQAKARSREAATDAARIGWEKRRKRLQKKQLKQSK